MFVFNFYEATNLRFKNPTRHRDVFINVSLGAGYVKTTAPVRNNRDAVNFEEGEVLVWIDDTNWANEVRVSVCEANGLRADDHVVANATFSLLPYMKNRPENARNEIRALYCMDGAGLQGGLPSNVLNGTISMKVGTTCAMWFYRMVIPDIS